MQCVISGDMRRGAVVAADLVPKGREARVFEGSLSDREACARAVADAQAVIHFVGLDASLKDTAAGDALAESSLGVYTLLSAALEAGVTRFVLVSTLRLFSRVPRNYEVNEAWKPYPTTELAELIPFLTERAFREMVRAAPDGRAVCLRLGDDLTEDEIVGAVDEALARLEDKECARFWRVIHRGKTERAPADDRPWREALFPASPLPAKPIQKVVILGAGGPVGRALADELKADYVLRLADVRPLADIAAENVLQSAGAPVARPLSSPHENCIVDVGDLDAVTEACAGMDAIINLTVVREDFSGAFRVNLTGAYHTMQAARRHGIRRIVHTGPQQITVSPDVGYHGEDDLPGNAPARPGLWVYTHSKFLGQETVRLFAEQGGHSVPCLLFNGFLNPEIARHSIGDFFISWADSARALRAALEVPDLPSPFEIMSVGADLPHSGVSMQRARELLGWKSQDDLSPLWRDGSA